MRVWIVACIIVMSLIITSCGKDRPASSNADTPEEIAKTVVQGLIEGNTRLIRSTMKDDLEAVDLYVQMMVSDEAPKFADRKLEDFTIEKAKRWGKEVFSVKSKDEKLEYFLKIEKIGDKFYFNGTEP